jgi:dethiobiotin synthetase
MKTAGSIAAEQSPGWIMLGTDTGVGKTFIGCVIVESLRARGYRLRVRKPVETGCTIRDGQRIPADATALWMAAGQIEPLETVCPLRFLAPLAAPLAARQEGTLLHFADDLAPLLPTRAELLTSTTEQDKTRWLIESAGGLLSPLAEDALGLDLAQYTGLPVILVAPDRLGTLSGLFAALEALDRRHIPISAIVLNRRPEDMPRHKEAPTNNLELIHTWLPRILTHGPLPAVLGQDMNPTNSSTFPQRIVATLLGETSEP